VARSSWVVPLGNCWPHRSSSCRTKHNAMAGPFGDTVKASKRTIASCYLGFRHVFVLQSVGRSWLARLCLTTFTEAIHCFGCYPYRWCFVGGMACTTFLVERQPNVGVSFSALASRHGCRNVYLHLALQQHQRQSFAGSTISHYAEYIWSSGKWRVHYCPGNLVCSCSTRPGSNIWWYKSIASRKSLRGLTCACTRQASPRCARLACG